VSSAAVSDFVPERLQGKLKSGGRVTIHLEPFPKLLNEVIDGFHPLTLAFKMGWEPESDAVSLLSRGASLVVTNTPDAMGAPGGDFGLITAEQRGRCSGTKEDAAEAIWSRVLEIMQNRER
jgi:phosphopantothenoylcysteine decarboxylase/phosphopantothenate--cysteine ligase